MNFNRRVWLLEHHAFVGDWIQIRQSLCDSLIIMVRLQNSTQRNKTKTCDDVNQFCFFKKYLFFFFFLLLTTSSKKKVVISTQKRLSKLSWSWNLCLNSESMFQKQMSRHLKNVCTMPSRSWFFLFPSVKTLRISLWNETVICSWWFFTYGSMEYVYERKIGFLDVLVLNILQSYTIWIMSRGTANLSFLVWLLSVESLLKSINSYWLNDMNLV